MKKKSISLTPLLWFLIIGTGFFRGAYYMVFPFLAIYLKNEFQADLATIGWIIGFGPLAGAIIGFYGAYLSDLFGRRFIITTALLLWGVVQCGFGFAHSLWVFGVLSSLSGILRAVAEPIIQAVISENSEGEQRTKAYHLRYYAVNLGAAIGPSIGAWLVLKEITLAFCIAGGSLIFFAFGFSYMTRSLPARQEPFDNPPDFLSVLKILSKDKALLYFVSAAILCSIAFSQGETTLPLILNNLMGKEGIKVFAWVISTNAITIVLFQLLLNRLTSHLPIAKTVAWSAIVFGLGFFGFGISGTYVWAYILSMIVVSLGEILVFSNGYILIDNLAPKNLKATYHSASNLFSIGLALGPPLGAWFLKYTGQFGVFTMACILCFICSWCYLKGDEAISSKESMDKKGN